jgi:hypothetical protein
MKKAMAKEKLSMEQSKQSMSGINLGGVYLRVPKAVRVYALSRLSSSLGESSEAEKTYAQRLLISDEQIETILATEEIRLAARLAFADQARTIEELYHDALKLAQIRRNEVDLRPKVQIREKLMYEELLQFGNVLIQYERQEVDILDVRLRLGSVVYYSTQQFVHDIREAVKEGVEHLDEGLIVEGILRAVADFRHIVQRACEQSHHSPAAGFEAARRKFGLRILLQRKDETLERLVIQDLPG